MLPSENLDRLTGTFKSDRDFFDALFLSPSSAESAKTVCKMLVLHRWLHLYFLHFQEALVKAIPDRFPPPLADTARQWTLALTAQIARDSGLICFLCIRGLQGETGPSVRRCLENIGVLAHFWTEPLKARFLTAADGKNFRFEFIQERDIPTRETLKAAGIAKRFSALRIFANPATALYAIVSRFSLHGGTPDNLIGKSLSPTPTACAFANRPTPTDEGLKNDLMYCEKGQELTLAELAYLVGVHGKKTKEVHEGGNVLLDLCGVKAAPEPYLERLKADLMRQLMSGGNSAN
jgi:hypothetical protein